MALAYCGPEAVGAQAGGRQPAPGSGDLDPPSDLELVPAERHRTDRHPGR
jgi:hypothetical protein